MYSKDTDKAWEYFGNTDPYFSVLTWDEYKKENLSSEARARFFKSGDDYIALILKTIHDYVDASFRPDLATALDFGCGVGRLVIPLARMCKSVTGIDVSDSMLREAEKNCVEYGVSNINLAVDIEKAAGLYDFIHSFIVFQHIPVKRGEMILKRLIDLLRDGGVGVIHLTYYRKESMLGRLKYQLYTSLPLPLVTGLWNLLKRRPFQQPIMQMNEYNLNNIFRLLQESGCHHSIVRFTGHGDTYGVVLFFQKSRLPLL